MEKFENAVVFSFLADFFRLYLRAVDASSKNVDGKLRAEMDTSEFSDEDRDEWMDDEVDDEEVATATRSPPAILLDDDSSDELREEVDLIAAAAAAAAAAADLLIFVYGILLRLSRFE